MIEEDEKRSSANTIYYGKTFRNYGRGWVEVGLRDYVPMQIIVKVIGKTVFNDSFTKNWSSLSKDKVVDIMMQIYDKASIPVKQRIEKWCYSYRFKRKIQTEMPFLRRLDSFYMYLRTNPNYTIQVPPDAATKVAAHLTLVGITDLAQVKSVLKSILCKRKTDWDVFDSLFNTWFESSSKSYGVSSKTIITPSAYLKLEITPPDTLSVEQALIKLRRVLSGDNPRIESDAESKSSEGENPDDYTEEESESEYAPSDEPSDETGEPSDEEGEGEPEPSEDDSEEESDKESDESSDEDKDGEDDSDDKDGDKDKEDDSKDDDSEEESDKESDDDKDGDKDKESESETEIAFGGSF